MTNESQNPELLTEYESLQVAKIATWKAAFPNPFGEIFRRAAQPFGRLFERMIPDKFAVRCIKATYTSAEYSATFGDIKHKAGVAHIADLRQKPLETCDHLARDVAVMAQAVATVEGALTGFGGVFTTVLDIPILFGLCLRTIVKTGHCYGYPLDRPTDKAWVLGAFTVALSHTQQKKVQLASRLRELEGLMIQDTQEQIIVDEAIALLAQLEIFQAIPFVGILSGALLNLSSVHKMEKTARHLFQERWLRDNGKVEEIEPASHGESLLSIHGWSGAAARASHNTIYGLSFGAAFAVFFVAEIWNSVGHSQGARFDSVRA